MGDIIIVSVLFILIIMGIMFVIYKAMSGAKEFKPDIQFKPHKAEGDHDGHKHDL